ncbi:hypothetical protein [Pyxidicoccus xibeiensis]|uniref:hypothetical protein n=1 Tax=Pyxidicoccus xibeiensis TaxID=2906759 RepID=UPI0020A7670A|nr:hypothetical protein [Pyxidicoccus xibeiensis]MCP3145261.1 hypothetical protein [Pyxidicoccus xibeiensis]
MAPQLRITAGRPLQLSVAQMTVYVIGAPAPGEIKAKHPFQFVEAAMYRGMDDCTLCLVEKTGYEAGEVKLTDVEAKLAPAKVQWITETDTLAKALGKLPENSVKALRVYSHGLPGELTLRYGWEGKANYGLKPSEVPGLNKKAFTADCQVEFHSCNTASYSDDGVLAQDLATHLDLPVKAWTGRTSYREVNDGAADGDAGIHASDASKGGSRLFGGYDTTELWRQYGEGRVPRFIALKPLDSFEKPFELHSSLAGTTEVGVANNGKVMVTVSDSRYLTHSFYEATNKLYITLCRNDGIDDDIGTATFAVGKTQSYTWSGLKGGWYYLKIAKDNANAFGGYETIRGTVRVQVQRP